MSESTEAFSTSATKGRLGSAAPQTLDEVFNAAACVLAVFASGADADSLCLAAAGRWHCDRSTRSTRRGPWECIENKPVEARRTDGDQKRFEVAPPRPVG